MAKPIRCIPASRKSELSCGETGRLRTWAHCPEAGTKAKQTL